MRSFRRLASALLLASAALPNAAAAQDAGTLDQRVTRLERQLHAVQRKVFPGGDGAIVEPELSPQAAPPVAAGVPASAPLADLAARVDALEHSLTQLTSQSEQNGYDLRQLQAAFEKYRAATDARLSALEARGVAAGAASQPPASDSWPPTPLQQPSRAAPPPEEPPAAEAPPPASRPAATGDPEEDAYMAGYTLWTQKKYEEAEAALQAVAAKYPNTRRASYAQNLLGRAYLDDGKPALAAKAFYKNYQDQPRGERAPDSLYFLGQSLLQLKKPAEACKVYAELDDVYGPTLKDPLKGKVAAAEKDASCKR